MSQVVEQKELFKLFADIAADPARRERARQQLIAILARQSFARFVQEAWHVVEPSTRLDWNWHHQLICDTLQAMFHAWRDAKSEAGKRHKFVKGLPKNAVFNLPPGSLKSRIIAVCYQVWCWLHEPGMKFICLSVNEDAMLRDARMSRELIRSEWFQSTFSPRWELKKDQEAIGNYGNTSGGERLSKPSGSEIVGLRGDCISGESLVFTELGEIPIELLHTAAVNGLPLPRVWTIGEDGKPVLNRILATRRTTSVNTVTVRTQSNKALTCTDDHKIANGDGTYTKARDKAGTPVPVVREFHQIVKTGFATEMLGLPLRDVNMRPLFSNVSQAGSGIRQTIKTSEQGHLLQPRMRAISPPDRQESFADDPVRELSDAVSTIFEQADAEDLLASLRECASSQGTSIKDVTRQALSVLRNDDGGEFDQKDVLRSSVRREASLDSDARAEKSTFQEFPEIRWEPLGETVRVNQGAGRVDLLRVWRTEQLSSGIDSTPYRSQSSEQRTREFNNSLRSLPHDSPQIETDTVLSVNRTPEAISGESIDVYDLHIENNHNFIASGISISNCLLIDDPNNPKEAENKVERDHVNQLWDTNIYNRVNDARCSMRIGVQQRTNAMDWTGHVIKNQKLWSPDNEFGWLHVVLPAEFERDRAFVMPNCLAKYCTWPGAVTRDPRTVEGESIHPDRFTPDYLKAEKERWRNTGNYVGQMQQRPAALEGQKVNRKWWGWFRLAEGVRDDLPPTGHYPRPPMCHDGAAETVHGKHHHPEQWDFDWITISVDPAAKKTEKGSLYGLLAIAGKGGRRYVLDDRSQRGAFHEILDVIGDMVKTWRPDTILIEPKAAGPDLMDTLREQMFSGDLPMVAIEEAEPGNSDKEMRFEASLPYIKNGAVYLLDGAPWLEDFVRELSEFPNGETDDRVDALSQCLNSKRAVDDELPDW